MESEYYKCLEPDCKVKEVYTEFRLLALHYGGSHRGVKVPTIEQSKIGTVPEGYQIRKPKGKADKPDDKLDGKPTEEEEGEGRYPAGLKKPLDDADRLGDILDIYGAKPANIDRIKKVFRYDKSLQTNPRNLEVVLKTWLDKELQTVISMIVGQFFGTAVETDDNGTRYIPIGFRRTPEGGCHSLIKARVCTQYFLENARWLRGLPVDVSGPLDDVSRSISGPIGGSIGGFISG
jgi:hypothetical protein